MNTKQNDWFAVIMKNPDKDFSDFANSNINDSNTVLRDREYYKEKEGVKAAFTGEDGNFNDVAYNQFYDSALRTFNAYIQEDVSSKALKDYRFAPENIFVDQDAPRRQSNFHLYKVANPELSTVGIANLFGSTDGPRSYAEAAQTQQVFNWETQEFEDWTPNDDNKRGLLHFWKTPALIEARWEEDGTHTDSEGRVLVHKEGDWKLNAEGNPYYETLGNRNTANKNFLHLSDTLTIDGSTWNKYDFFDSDGKEKSIAGITGKLAFSIAPIFIPYVNTAYGLTVGAAYLGQALSILGKSALEATRDDAPDTGLWQTLNTYDSKVRSLFEASISEKGQESLFNYEQAANMIGDVVSQFYQQRTIAKIPMYLGLDKKSMNVLRAYNKEHGATYLQRYGKTLEQAIREGDVNATAGLKNFYINALTQNNTKAIQRGADMSKLYMALTQSAPIYDSFKEYGFDEQTAAIGMLGAIVGFKMLFDSELGDLALKNLLGLDDVGAATRSITGTWAKGVNEKLSKVAGQSLTDTQKLSRIQEAANSFVKHLKTAWNSEGTLANMLKEGTEEITEEILEDTIMNSAHYINKALTWLGFDRQQDTYNYFDSDPLSRYAVAGIGGVLGGAIFPQITKYEAWLENKGKIKQDLPKNDILDFERLIRHKGLKAVERVIEQQIKNGEFGSTTLSLDIEDSSGDNITYKPTNDPEKTQNAIVGNVMMQIARSIDAVINSEGLGFTDDQLINNALGKDTRLMALSKSGVDAQIVGDFENLLDQLIDSRFQLSQYQDRQNPDPIVVENYNQVKQKIEDLVSGKRAGEYTERMQFLLNRSINAPFIEADIHMFALHKGVNYSTADEATRRRIDTQYAAASKDKNEVSFEVFKYLRDQSQPVLQDFAQRDISAVRNEVQELFTELNTNTLSEFISDDEKENLRQEIIGGRTIDEFIAENRLNPNNELLTEENKQHIYNLAVESQLYQKLISLQNRKATSRLEENQQLGLDPNLFLRDATQISYFINKLQDIRTRYGFIDVQSRNQLRYILDKYNSFDINAFIRNISENANGINFSEDDVTNNDALNTLVLSQTGQEEPLDFAGRSIDDGSNDYIFIGADSGMQVRVPQEALRDILYQQIEELQYTDVNSLFGGIITPGYTSTAKGATGTELDLFIQNNIDNYIRTKGNILDGLKTAYDLTWTSYQENPIYDLLSQISESLTGEDVFTIIREEEGNFKSSAKITDFVISNSLKEQQLKTAKVAIELLKSVINSSTTSQYSFDPVNARFDFLESINYFNRLNALPELQGITEAQASIMVNDLNSLDSVISYLLDISSLNSGSKILDNKKTLIRNEGMLLQVLGGDHKQSIGIDQLTYGEDVQFFDYDGISDIERLRNVINSNSSSDEDIEFVEGEHSKMLEYYYNKFNELEEDHRNEVIDKLSSNQYINYLNNIETKIKRNSEYSDLSPEFIAQYTVSMLAVNQKEVKRTFSEILAEDANSYAPFFSQYLNIAMSYATIANPDLINQYLNNWKKNLSETKAANYSVFDSFIINSGDPGSGKTTAVAYFINKLISKLHPDKVVAVAAPNTLQSTKFASILNIPRSFNKYKLFSELLSNSGFNKYESILTELESFNPLKNTGLSSHIIDQNFNLVSSYFTAADINVDAIPDVLFIDEYTHFSKTELELLIQIGKLANKNLNIVAFGDTKQDGYKLSGIDFSAVGFIFRTPELTISIRANNNHKKDNITIMSNLLRRLNETINLNSLNGNLVDFASDIDNINNNVAFKYYETTQGNSIILQGDKLVSGVSEEYLRKLANGLAENEQIALITDKPNSDLSLMFGRLSSEFGAKFIAVPFNKVQGSEFKYTVVDVDYTPTTGSTISAKNSGFLTNLKEFYTAITRSSDGTLVIDSKNILINHSLAINYPSVSELSDSDITEYKGLVQRVYKNTLGEQTADTAEVTPVVVPVTDTETVDTQEEAKEEAHEQLTDTEQWKREHVQVSFRYNNIGLQRFTDAVGNYHYTTSQTSNVDENLQGLLSEGVEYTEDNLRSVQFGTYTFDAMESLATFRNLVSRNSNDLNKMIDTLPTTQLVKLTPFIQTYFNGDIQSFKRALKNGVYKVKVSDYNPNTDYSINKDAVTPSNNIFSRLVFQITNPQGKSLDISLGIMSDINNIDKGNAYRKKLESAQIRTNIKNGPVYFPIQTTDNLFIKNKITLDKNIRYDRNYTLKMFKRDHPDLNFDSALYVASQNEDGKYRKSGDPFVFVSSDLFLDKSDLMSDYGTPDSSTIKAYVQIIGYTYEGFFERWNNILQNKDTQFTSSDLGLFAPDIVAPRMLASIFKLEDILSKSDLARINEYNQQVEAFNAARPRNPELHKALLPTSEQDILLMLNKLRTIIYSLSNIRDEDNKENGLKAIKSYTDLNSLTTQKSLEKVMTQFFTEYPSEDYPIFKNFNKSEMQFLEDSVKRNGGSLYSTIEALMDVDNVSYKNFPSFMSDQDKIDFMDKIQHVKVTIDNVSKMFNGINTLDLKDLFNDGILFKMARSFAFISKLSSNLELDGGIYTDALYAAFDYGNYFPEGIFSNGRDPKQSAPVNGYYNSALSEDQVFINVELAAPSAQMRYDYININSPEFSTQVVSETGDVETNTEVEPSNTFEDKLQESILNILSTNENALPLYDSVMELLSRSQYDESFEPELFAKYLIQEILDANRVISEDGFIHGLRVYADEIVNYPIRLDLNSILEISPELETALENYVDLRIQYLNENEAIARGDTEDIIFTLNDSGKFTMRFADKIVQRPTGRQVDLGTLDYESGIAFLKSISPNETEFWNEFDRIYARNPDKAMNWITTSERIAGNIKNPRIRNAVVAVAAAIFKRVNGSLPFHSDLSTSELIKHANDALGFLGVNVQQETPARMETTTITPATIESLLSTYGSGVNAGFTLEQKAALTETLSGSEITSDQRIPFIDGIVDQFRDNDLFKTKRGNFTEGKIRGFLEQLLPPNNNIKCQF